MPTIRYALIVIGTYKDSWGKLSRSKQSEFIARVEETTRQAGVAPVNGYHLSATPGAFIEIWEGASRAAIDRAVKGFQDMEYSRYVEARFLIGERVAEEEKIQPQKAQRAQGTQSKN
jgi:flavin-binding protein dodecin